MISTQIDIIADQLGGQFRWISTQVNRQEEDGGEQLGPITVISKKYDGATREIYTGQLLEVVGPMIRIQVRAGTPLYRGPNRPEAATEDAIEMYFTDRWFNVLHFLERSNLRYLWYANIAMPAKLDGTTLQWVDLDLDVVCHLDGSILTLDYKEFEENRSTMEYPYHVVEQAMASLHEVTLLSGTAAFPFDRVTQIGHWQNLP